MTCACDNLIIPVLLMNNPGVTREEFFRLIEQTPVTRLLDRNKGDTPWDLNGASCKRIEVYEGLEGLAKIMGINPTDQFNEFQRFRKDENGLSIGPPDMSRFYDWFLEDRFNFYHELEQFEEGKYRFAVLVHERNELGPREIAKGDNREKLNVGDTFEYGKDYPYDCEDGLVTKILSERYIKRGHPDWSVLYSTFDTPKREPFYRYTAEVRKITKVYRLEKYRTEQEFYKAWPQFHYDSMFDWSQESGHIVADYPHGKLKHMRWIKKGDRYYFDPENFNSMSGGVNEEWGGDGHWGYVDLMCTAAAMEVNAWKLFSSHGMRGDRNFYEAFLRDFPEARRKVEKAIAYATLALGCKHRGMTNTEMLWEKLIPPGAE